MYVAAFHSGSKPEFPMPFSLLFKNQPLQLLHFTGIIATAQRSYSFCTHRHAVLYLLLLWVSISCSAAVRPSRKAIGDSAINFLQIFDCCAFHQQQHQEF